MQHRNHTQHSTILVLLIKYDIPYFCYTYHCNEVHVCTNKHLWKSCTGMFGMKELWQLLCCVFKQMLLKRYSGQHPVTSAAGTCIYKCVSYYWLLLSLHPQLHFQSHQHWKSEDLLGLLSPISGAWQIFPVHLTYQKKKKRWKLCSSALVRRKPKFKHLTSNSGISLSEQKWLKIN